MSVSDIVLVTAAAAMLLALLLAWERQNRDLFAILIFLGVAGIAILVTMVQVTRYRARQGGGAGRHPVAARPSAARDGGAADVATARNRSLMPRRRR